MSFLLVSLMHSDHYRGYYFRKVALSATRAENTFSTITILEIKFLLLIHDKVQVL